MPITITCSECSARLTLRSTPTSGGRVKCPKCGTINRIEEPEEKAPPARKKLPAASPSPSAERAKREEIKAKAPPLPKKTSAPSTSSTARRARQEAIEDGESTRKRSRAAVGAHEPDDEEDESPRFRKQPPARGNKGLILGLSLGGGALVLGLGILFAVVLSRGKTNSPPQAALTPPATNPLPSNNPPANPPPANGSLSHEVLTQVKQATTLIRVQTAEGQDASGSGFLDANSGLVLTNAHVVGMKEKNNPPRSLQVVFNSGQGAAKERALPAKVVTVDQSSDLAVLRLADQPGGQPLPAGLVIHDAKDLHETQKVYVFGFPFGDLLSTGGNPAITISESSVSSLRYDNGGRLTQVQVNGGMNPGNSGGPVVDTQGRVIGVAVAIIKGTQINFAIPADHVQTVLRGRISTIVTEEPVQRDGQVVMKVSLTTIDPLQKIQRLAIDWWLGDPTEKVPPSQSQPMGAARQTVALTYDAAQQRAQGEIMLPNVAPMGKVIWLQPSCTSGTEQPRWSGGMSRVFEQPPDPKPVQVTVQPVPGQLPLDLKSKGVFQVRSPDGDNLNLLMNIVSKLTEETRNVTPQGSQVIVGIKKFEIGRSINGKGPPPNPRLNAIVQNIGKMLIQLQLDARGAVVSSKPDLTRVPVSSRAVLEGYSDQMQQSLEAVSVAVPAGILQPNQIWTARRKFTLDTFLFAAPGFADMTYKYIGLRQLDNRTVAVLNLAGVVRPVGRGGQFTGKVRGTVSIDVATGRVLHGKVTTDATLEIRDETGTFRSTGTLEIDVTRAAGQ